MPNYTIYHNPRCSKSRQTLALLEDRGLDVDIIEYLKTPPTMVELKKILTLLGKSPRDILRKGEEAYKQFDLANTSNDDQFILEKMLEQPKLIERPIVIFQDKAVLGRPPENVLQLIDQA